MNNVDTWLTAVTLVDAPIEKVWEFWTSPEHMIKWNNTSEEWHTPQAENDVRSGGRLFLRMEKKDGSAGFDYACIYDDVITNKKISYTTSDHRKTTILFDESEKGVVLTETFQPENTTPVDIQKSFCQSILNNFKRYAEHGIL